MMLEVKNVHKSFHGREVLKGIDLTVDKGDVVAILGPSGSGKTTLLRCINYLERAEQGELIFDGEHFDMRLASKADVTRMRKKTAFVFQNYNLFLNKTVLQNVTLGLTRTRRTPIPASSPADSSSGWPLPGVWPPIRRSSTLTSRPPPSIQS